MAIRRGQRYGSPVGGTDRRRGERGSIRTGGGNRADQLLRRRVPDVAFALGGRLPGPCVSLVGIEGRAARNPSGLDGSGACGRGRHGRCAGLQWRAVDRSDHALRYDRSGSARSSVDRSPGARPGLPRGAGRRARDPVDRVTGRVGGRARASLRCAVPSRGTQVADGFRRGGSSRSVDAARSSRRSLPGVPPKSA